MNKVHYSSKSNEWETPKEIFNKLNSEFNFTLDPCASLESAKCNKFYTEEDNGLNKSWENEIVFCNPPYGRVIKDWVKKCSEESKHATVVMLIPARTDTKYFHEFIYNKANIKFLKGRIKFLQNGEELYPAPFPSMIVVFNRKFL